MKNNEGVILKLALYCEATKKQNDILIPQSILCVADPIAFLRRHLTKMLLNFEVSSDEKHYLLNGR